MDDAAEPLVPELTDLVFQVAGRLRTGFNAIAAELDLPPAQAMALANLRSPAPMRELADWLACDASNVTGIVDGLERRGLVTRQPDPTDRRVKHLVLTDEGTRRREILQTRSLAAAEAVFDIPGDDRTRLRDLLRVVLAGSAGCGPRDGRDGPARPAAGRSPEAPPLRRPAR